MKSDTFVLDRIIKRYRVPQLHIKEFNKKYDKVKKNLGSYGPRLAGRLEEELEFTPILQQTKAFPFITKCMDDYINACANFHLLPRGSKHLEIISCWVNDMKEGEYNPPHIHHDATGYSTVLFLRIPEFINDARDSHKFKDGELGFVYKDDSTSFTPIVGDFYIFEARHQHFVLPFKTKVKGEIRRSMSFNFIIRNIEQLKKELT